MCMHMTCGTAVTEQLSAPSQLLLVIAASLCAYGHAAVVVKVIPVVAMRRRCGLRWVCRCVYGTRAVWAGVGRSTSYLLRTALLLQGHLEESTSLLHSLYLFLYGTRAMWAGVGRSFGSACHT